MRQRDSAGIEVIDPDGERFWISRKIAVWLVDEVGRAKWMGPSKIALLFPARELRGRSSGGFITLQLVGLTNRRRKH
jgi:hypothetical protein